MLLSVDGSMGREVARAGLALACVVVWGLVMLLVAGCASGRLEPVRVPTAAIVER